MKMPSIYIGLFSSIISNASWLRWVEAYEALLGSKLKYKLCYGV